MHRCCCCFNLTTTTHPVSDHPWAGSVCEEKRFDDRLLLLAADIAPNERTLPFFHHRALLSRLHNTPSPPRHTPRDHLPSTVACPAQGYRKDNRSPALPTYISLQHGTRIPAAAAAAALQLYHPRDSRRCTTLAVSLRELLLDILRAHARRASAGVLFTYRPALEAHLHQGRLSRLTLVRYTSGNDTVAPSVAFIQSPGAILHTIYLSRYKHYILQRAFASPYLPSERSTSPTIATQHNNTQKSPRRDHESTATRMH